MGEGIRVLGWGRSSSRVCGRVSGSLGEGRGRGGGRTSGFFFFFFFFKIKKIQVF